MEDINKSIRENQTARITNILKGFSTENDLGIIKAQFVELQAAVGVVFDGDRILLGLCKCDDERNGCWCFPGGGIDFGEDCLKAAIREVYEETGVVCSPLELINFQHPIKPHVAFCLLRPETTEITFNDEYTDVQWFPLSELPDNILPMNIEILKILL